MIVYLVGENVTEDVILGAFASYPLAFDYIVRQIPTHGGVKLDNAWNYSENVVKFALMVKDEHFSIEDGNYVYGWCHSMKEYFIMELELVGAGELQS